MTIAQTPFDYQHYINWIIGEHEKLQEEDYFEFAGQQFSVKPTVFNPNIATSSKIFATGILKLDLTGKRVLDAGCGSGILSIAALKAGASFVYGFDINKAAVETTKENLKRANMPLSYFEVHQGNSLPDLPNSFDYILFNPPFFDASTDVLWKRSVCDPKRMFLNNILADIGKILRPDGKLIMIVGGELNLKYVKTILFKNGFSNVEAQNLRVQTSLNLKLIYYLNSKIVD